MNTLRCLVAIILWSMLIGEIITISLAAMVITVGTMHWSQITTVYLGSCFIGSPFAWGLCRVSRQDRERDERKACIPE